MEISASVISHGVSNVKIEFDHIMKNNSISKDDLLIEIVSSQTFSFDWKASYLTLTILSIDLTIHHVLVGSEILSLSFINYKKFRGPNGGCIAIPSLQLNTTLGNSLEGSIKSAKAIGTYIKYIILGGIVIGALLLVAIQGSIELIWSLINTLQIIAYLPLITPFYPEHVKVMFNMLEFANMQIPYMDKLFNYMFNFAHFSTPSFNERFLDNGIGTPLFIANCASLLMSLIFT